LDKIAVNLNKVIQLTTILSSEMSSTTKRLEKLEEQEKERGRPKVKEIVRPRASSDPTKRGWSFNPFAKRDKSIDTKGDVIMSSVPGPSPKQLYPSLKVDKPVPTAQKPDIVSYPPASYSSFSYSDSKDHPQNRIKIVQGNPQLTASPQNVLRMDTDKTRIDQKKVYEKVKYLKPCISYDLDQVSVSAFLKQFEEMSFTGFTEKEYIQCVHSFVPDESKRLMGQLGIQPLKMNYLEYVQALTNVRVGYYMSELDIVTSLHELKSKNLTLVQIYIQVSQLVDTVDDGVWPDGVKDRQVHYYVKKHLPVSLRVAYDQLVSVGADNSEQFPSREVQKRWLMRNQRNMDVALTDMAQ
jgi:hypothetical protein